MESNQVKCIRIVHNHKLENPEQGKNKKPQEEEGHSKKSEILIIHVYSFMEDLTTKTLWLQSYFFPLGISEVIYVLYCIIA